MAAQWNIKSYLEPFRLYWTKIRRETIQNEKWNVLEHLIVCVCVCVCVNRSPGRAI